MYERKNKENVIGELKRCKKCGKEKPFTAKYFYKDKSAKHGLSYTCKTCEKSKNFNRLIRHYKKADKLKNREFSISESFLESALKISCTYCNYPATGLDRIDNSIGHIESNCVPCCRECNSIRMDQFTFQEMKIIGKTIKQIKDLRNEKTPLYIASVSGFP